ncbi:MAG: hypothetical protein CVU55_04060 [Deltaproteobacteria bacterium HGW-Deltaproteobacteria-13]|jgi:opacity protein-like surface antigen|nr:MAG: hypothetical protein CVU55_04060 [Deltaproteobacteria bacterium HGW-Deltaproteobacteria-13]
MEVVMKKTFSVSVGLFMLLMIPVISFGATKGPYMSALLGGTYLTESDLTDNGVKGKIEYTVGIASVLAGGYNFGMFRMEGEIGYQRNSMDKATVCDGGGCGGGSISGNTSALSGLVNGYIDFVNSSPVTPYISGGIGVAYVKVDVDQRNGSGTDSFNDTIFAYQVGAGLAYAINQNLSLDLKYRYFATPELDLEGSKATFGSHNVYFGLRYTF